MDTEINTTESSAQIAPVISPANSREIATAAGDYRLAVTKEVNRILNENRGHPLKATKVGLKRLSASKLISVQEQKSLEKVCTAVFSALRGDSNAINGSTQVRGIYDQMLIDEAASPVALAIASIAASVSQSSTPSGPNLPEGVVDATATNRGDFGMVAGAVVGASIGGVIGGAGGAIIGAVVGGIAGGIAGACS